MHFKSNCFSFMINPNNIHFRFQQVAKTNRHPMQKAATMDGPKSSSAVSGGNTATNIATIAEGC
jgi:hypothetical protein